MELSADLLLSCSSLLLPGAFPGFRGPQRPCPHPGPRPGATRSRARPGAARAGGSPRAGPLLGLCARLGEKRGAEGRLRPGAAAGGNLQPAARGAPIAEPCASRLPRDRRQGVRGQQPRLRDEGRDRGRLEGSRLSERALHSRCPLLNPRHPTPPQQEPRQQRAGFGGCSRPLGGARRGARARGRPLPRAPPAGTDALPPRPQPSLSARRVRGAADTRALAPPRSGQTVPRGSPREPPAGWNSKD
ncbi:translation initiation factor IF-2-like [Mustela putorius furo]|uniref:Translation initiation factor IF-2-like n=1 Tax=Mustela putorius furo TaxID=9669 RepID=A0A8U0RMD9_MUSPF|nr:translation initiation factor IF-2-like [Mustela putorius furo]